MKEDLKYIINQKMKEDIKYVLKKILRTLLPLKCYLNLMNLNYFVCNYKKLRTDEYYKFPYRINNGRKSNRKYVIFRPNRGNYEILEGFRASLGIYSVCLKENLTPIVVHGWEADFQSKGLMIKSYLDHCFEPKSSSRLKEALQTRGTIVMPVGRVLPEKPYIRVDGYDRYYKKWNRIFQQYIPFKKDFLKVCEEEYSRIFPKTGKVLAVSVREVFRIYQSVVPEIYRRHPKDVELHVVAKKVRELMKAWSCDYIFLAAQFQETIEYFERRFPGKLIISSRKRMEIQKLDIKNARSSWQLEPKAMKEKCEENFKKQGMDDRQHTLGYVKEMYLVSKCHALAATKSGGVIAALVWNGGKYEHLYIFEDENKSRLY